MKIGAIRVSAFLLMLAVLVPLSLSAQTKPVQPALSSDRCLLIVETSKSTRSCANAMVKVVQDMLMSGLNGQLRPGDTLGVWTFDDDLYTGRFPLQTWSALDQKDIARRTAAFLKAQKFDKEPSLSKVLPALTRVIEGSQLLTVILVSSGDEKMRGTQFDERINEFYRQWHDQQQQAHMPFVTVLRVKNGQLADYVVNTPPWPLQMPRRSAETQSARALPAKPLEAPKVASSATVAPLIVSGKKPVPDLAPAPQPAPVAAKVEAPVPAPVVSLPQPSAPPAAVAKIEPPIESAPKPAPAPAPPPEPTPAAPAPRPVVLKQPEPAAAPVAMAKIEPAPAGIEKPAPVAPPAPPPAPVAAPKPLAEVVKAPASKPVVAALVNPEPPTAPPVPKPAPAPGVVEQAKPSPTPEVKPAPAPAVAAAPARPPETRTDASVAVSAAPRPAPAAPPPAARSVAPAQVATVVSDGPIASHKLLWVAGLILAGIAVGFTFVLRSRSRAAPQASLITRSFERKDKL